MSADVTFLEEDQYFTRPYLQGKVTFMENKDKDLFLLDFPLSSSTIVFIPPPEVQSESSVSVSSPIVPVVQSEPNTQFESNIQPEIELEPHTLKLQWMIKGKETQDSTHPLLVYSKRRAPIPQPMQV